MIISKNYGVGTPRTFTLVAFRMTSGGLEEFVTALRAGDVKAALEAVPSEVQASVVRRIQRSLGVPPSEALSLYHRSVMRLESTKGDFEYRGPTALGKYLFLTARSLFSQDEGNLDNYHGIVAELTVMASDQLHVEVEPAFQPDLKVLASCLSKVPCKCQLLIVLKNHAGWSHDRIAHEIGSAYGVGSAASCRNQLKVCRRRLRDLVANSLDNDHK